MGLPADDPILAAALEAAGLAHRVAEIAPLAAREIELAAVEHETRTYFGGTPLLPAGAAWPVYRYRHDEILTWPAYARAEVEKARANGHLVDEADHVAVPLLWLGAIDFAELASFDPRLPREGRLALFLSTQTDVPDPELAGRKHARALYGTALGSCAQPPQPEPVLAGPLYLAPRIAITWDDDAWNVFHEDGWPEKDLLALSRESARRSRTHRVLVSPREEQGGRVPPEGHVALLRVANDDAMGMVYGDAAWATWIVRDEDLAAGRFDDARACIYIG